MSVCKHKKIVLIASGDSIQKIICEQCGCSMTRKIDPSFPSEYMYVQKGV
jgi:transcription elongation factor Elf1